MLTRFTLACLFVCTYLIALSPIVKAETIDLKGKLTVVDPYNRTVTKPMSISYSEQGGKGFFSIGPARFKVASKPEKYSIAMVLMANNYVWIQEFSKKPIKTLKWEIADHVIELNKEILEKPVKGDYILTIDGNDFFFSKKLAQIEFVFNDEGLESLGVDGMTASLGLNKSKNKDTCENAGSKTEDSSDSKDEQSPECPPKDETDGT
jgi:hypothetical protein